MPRCGKCREPILWGNTVNGKAMPLDVEPTPAGNIRIGVREPVADSDDEHIVINVLSHDAREEARARGELLYQSHFVSCPNAKEYRR